MKTKILILEHDAYDVELIQRELKKSEINYKYKIVNNELAYTNALKSFSPDIILSDYSLPSFDGTAAFEIKQKLATTIPFIFVTGTIGEENSVELIKKGVTDVTLKDKLFILNTKIEKALKESNELRIKKKTEQDLIESERRLAKAQQIAHIGSWDLDFTTNTVHFSDEACKIYGLTLEKNRQTFDGWILFIHPEDLELVLKKVKESRDSLQDVSFNHRIIQTNGTIRYVYSESRFEFDSNHKPINLYGIVQDVTKTKLIEDQIEFDKNNLNALINNTKDLMWSVDEDFKLITSNQPFDDVTKLMCGKVIEKGANILEAAFSQEQVNRYQTYYKRALAGETFIEIEYSLTPMEYWLETSFCPIQKLDKVVGVACHSRDITQRKKDEEKQKRNEASIKEAQAIAHLGSWELDFATQMAIWSEETCKIYGILPNENKQSYSDWLSYIHPEDKVYVMDKISVAKETLCETELNYRIILKDGTMKYIAVKSRYEFDDHGKSIGLYGTSHDVTELKLTERNLIHALFKLEDRVETRTKELVDRNKSILDSINYAKHIQTGLLCRPTQLVEVFSKSFILSMPRDIVSGDFFWCYQRRHKKFIVLADCTGHGVPAALLSIIGHNLLTQIIENEHIENPSEILELLDTRFAEAVKGDTQEVKDGMDIVVCVVDTYFNEVYFAGACNPLYVSDEKGQINQIAGSRHSIGGGNQEIIKKFETTRFPVIPGQRIYLSSDGYISQFGGQKGKKFMKSQFIKTLENEQIQTIDQQKEIFQNVLVDWMGNNEQVDDIMVVGIEL